MLLFALLLIGSSLFMVNFTFQQQFQVLKDVSLGAMSIFTWLLAVLATAMLLPKDIEDRTLYTILAKPVPRLEYLLGKLLGVLVLLLIAMLADDGGLRHRALRARTDRARRNCSRPPRPRNSPRRCAKSARRPSTANLIPGIVGHLCEGGGRRRADAALSTFASSSIFTIIVSVVIYVIGHVQPIAREYWLGAIPGGADPSPLLKVFLGVIALVFPDFQLFNLVDDIVVGNAVPLAMFLKTAGLGLGYISRLHAGGVSLFCEQGAVR